jgi:hypothetical protein
MKPTAIPDPFAAPKRPRTRRQPPAEAPATPQHRPRPDKPVRFTLDLDQDRHQFLKQYAVQVEARGATEVMRALLDELQADPQLADRIQARIWQR